MSMSKRKPVEMSQEILATAVDTFDRAQARRELIDGVRRKFGPAYSYAGSRWEHEGKLSRFVCTFEYSRWADWKHRAVTTVQGWFNRNGQDQADPA